MKRLVVISLACLAVLGLLLTGLNLWLAGKIKSTLEEKVSGSGKELYSLRIDDVRVNVLKGEVELSHIQLIQSPAGGTRDSNRMILMLYIPSVKAGGIELWQAWKGNTFSLSDLAFTRPKVFLCRTKTEKPGSKPEPGTSPELHQLLSAAYKEASAENISLKDATLLYRVFKRGRSAEHLAVDLSVSLNNILINDSASRDTSRCYYTKGIDARITDYVWSLSDSNYTILASNIDLSSSRKYLKIDSLYFSPNYMKRDLWKKEGENGYLTAGLWGIELSELNIKDLLEEKRIRASMLRVHGGKLAVFKNKQLNGKKERKLMPQQALRELSIQLSLDSTLLENIHIKYEEVSPEGKGPGVLTFERMNAAFGKFSNLPAYLASNPLCSLKIHASIMGAGRLELDIAGRLNDKLNTITCKGRVHQMNLSLLNTMLEPINTMRISKGYLDGLRFTAVFNDSKARGSVEFRYHDLQAELLDPVTGEQGVKEKVFTWFARVKIPEDNPDKKDKPARTGEIDYIRDPHKSVFSYLWKSVQTGMLSCLNLEGMAEKKKHLRK